MPSATTSTPSRADLATTPIFIGGEWQAGEADPIAVVDPSNEQVLAEVPSASDAQVDAALQAARDARHDWYHTGAMARGRLIREMADVMRDNVPELGELVLEESGKSKVLSTMEIPVSADFMTINAEWDSRIEGEILPSDTPREVINLLRVPFGVVAAICAWNWPLAVLVRKLAPALVTGNTVVIKPSEVTPLSTIRTVQLWAEQIDIPKGVVNLVTGGGGVGAELVCNPKTDYISFTGHRDTGKRIVADAARNLTQVGLELGGKAPAIVLADADMEVAVNSLVAARFTSTSGQQCGCAERVLVERPVLDEFVERYAKAAAALTVGDPRGEVDLGPLVNAAQFEKVSASVAKATEEGGTIVTGGGRPDEFDKGFYFAPTVITDVDRNMGIARDETFGPVMPVIPVDSLEEAFEIGNESRYGLTGYLYTSSYATAMEAAEDLECGELFINRSVGEAMHAHHGGHKESGYGGGEDGKHGVLKFTQVKAVYHNW